MNDYMAVPEEKKIYDGDDTVRYALGEDGNKPLIFIGINPSKADLEVPDATIKRVRVLTELKKCNGWIMLNIYPIREKNPGKLPNDRDPNLVEKNLKAIKEQLKNHPDSEILAMWGASIDKKTYLKVCLKEIVEQAIEPDRKWFYHGLTKNGNPKHPRHQLGVPYNEKFTEFDIKEYIKCLKL